LANRNAAAARVGFRVAGPDVAENLGALVTMGGSDRAGSVRVWVVSQPIAATSWDHFVMLSTTSLVNPTDLSVSSAKAAVEITPNTAVANNTDLIFHSLTRTQFARVF
jgi:hypothetical protein